MGRAGNSPQTAASAGGPAGGVSTRPAASLPALVTTPSPDLPAPPQLTCCIRTGVNIPSYVNQGLKGQAPSPGAPGPGPGPGKEQGTSEAVGPARPVYVNGAHAGLVGDRLRSHSSEEHLTPHRGVAGWGLRGPRTSSNPTQPPGRHPWCRPAGPRPPAGPPSPRTSQQKPQRRSRGPGCGIRWGPGKVTQGLGDRISKDGDTKGPSRHGQGPRLGRTVGTGSRGPREGACGQGRNSSGRRDRPEAARVDSREEVQGRQVSEKVCRAVGLGGF